MKYQTRNYMQLPRVLHTDDYKHLSINAKWLYITLKELEQRYCGHGKDTFIRSNSKLAEDAGMSLPTLKRAKAELEATDLISVKHDNFKAITEYEINY